MQNPGLNGADPASESRLEGLFWPSIHSDVDVDYLTTQGFWICFAIGLLSVPAAFAAGGIFGGVFTLLIYLLGACGVHPRDLAGASVAGSWRT